MDTTALVTHFFFDVEGGLKLVEALDRDQIPVSAAYWMFHEPSGEWRLYIATPLVSTDGIREAYGKILKEMRKIAVSGLSARNIVALDPSDQTVRLLSERYQTDIDAPPVTFPEAYIHGKYIPAAYIYRMKA